MPTSRRRSRHAFNADPLLPRFEAVEPRLLLSGAAADVLTYHNNNFRTGEDLDEAALTPANVGASTFGKVFTDAVDGSVYAQPLVMANVNVPGKGVHDLVIVATAHDSVYAFDADRPGPPLWQVSFIDPAHGVTSVPTLQDWQLDLYPEIGITGTPVIDPASNTLYVAAKTRIQDASGVREPYTLHALDVTSGVEKGEVPIQASVPGRGAGHVGSKVAFQPAIELQRPGLLLSHGVVYVGFGSLGAHGPYHGWLMGYSATSLQQLSVFNDTPNSPGASGNLGGIWADGDGPATDASGDVFVQIGAGDFTANRGGNSYGDTVLKLTPSLKVADYFAPQNAKRIGKLDLDLGSGGLILAPTSIGSNDRLSIGGGKDGTLYAIKTASLGHQRPKNPNLQAIANPAHSIFSTPAYSQGRVYINAVGDVLRQYQVVNGKLVLVAASKAPFGYPGATPSVSSNGGLNGIVWTIEKTGTREVPGPAVLHAYDAADVSHELYNSAMNPTRDRAANIAVKFVVPTVSNGRVYVGSNGGLNVYGLLPASS